MATKRKSSTRSRKQSPSGPELLALELQQIHSAENQLSRMLPRFAKVVESSALRQLLERRMKQGERVLQEVDRALEEFDGSARRTKNIAAQGLIDDAREHMTQMRSGPALDIVLAAGIRKTEHYCMGAWATARSLAQAVGQTNAVRAMDRAIKEGSALDDQLSKLAQREIAPALMSDDGEESESRSTQRRPRSRRKQSRH